MMGTGAEPARYAERVAALCDDALARLPEGRHRDAVSAVRARLYQPLRVAVAGRVKAGKSTLVNALVGRRVAPTAVEECTKVVTWCSFGVPERAEIVLTDGRRERMPLDDGRIPDPLGHELSQIQAVHVYLSLAALRRMTLIDTPGPVLVERGVQRAHRRDHRQGFAPRDSAGGRACVPPRTCDPPR
jgi:hypothetical protein